MQLQRKQQGIWFCKSSSMSAWHLSWIIVQFNSFLKMELKKFKSPSHTNYFNIVNSHT